MNISNPDISTIKKNLFTLLKGHQGKLYIISMAAAIKHKQISKDKLTDFLLLWTEKKAEKYNDLIRALHEVSEENLDFLCIQKIQPSEINRTKDYSTIMNSFVFHKFIINKNDLTNYMIPDLSPKYNHTIMQKYYCNQIRNLTSRNNWYMKDGYLGKPSPSPKLIWFTENSILQKEISNDKSTFSDATKARDVLGLISIGKEVFVLKIIFPGSVLTSDSSIKVGRPLFTDLISERYAPCLGKQGKRFYIDKWGVTANLHKIILNSTDILGAPERISTPIKLLKIGGRLRVECLGIVEETRGNTKGLDDDEAFLKLLSRNISYNQYINEIMGYINQK